MNLISLFLITLNFLIVWGLSPNTYLNNLDKEHLKSILSPAWNLQEVSQVFYGVLGYKYLGLAPPNKEDVCAFIKNKVKDGASIEDFYFVSATGKALACPIAVTPSVKQEINTILKDGSSPQELFYAVGAATNMKIDIDSAKAMRGVQQALKKDDSVLSLGYGFHIGSQLKGDLTSIFERIEDAIVQADEVDGNMLQFEGGLSITALVLSGAYKLAESSKKPIPIKEEQVIKFSNYLMSRKSVQMPKGVYYLLEAVTMLTNNQYHIPVAITLASSVAVSSDTPKIQVRATNLMGSEIGNLKLTAVSAVETKSGKSIISNKPFSSVTGNQKSLYDLDVMSLKPARGFYQLSVNAEGNDARLIGNKGASLTFKVLSSISLQDVEIGTADADQSTAPNLNKVIHPRKLSNILEADQHQRLMMRFVIQDTVSGKPTKAHQTFVKVTHIKSGREIIFIAEADTNDVYKFDMDVTAKRKEFGGVDGKYSLELLVGDASILNPLVWHLADINLSFPDGASFVENQDNTYKARSEIHHLFHTPDQRPSKVVSMAFTALCLSPFLVLLLGWGKLGVNISNIPLSFSSFGFHAGLAGIFVLFSFFFLQLNMFTTLRYLLGIGTVTFFCGNSMLSTIAGKRKQSELKG